MAAGQTLKEKGVLMNKAELVEVLAEKVSCTKTDAAGFLEALIQTVHLNIHDGIKISGLGTFASAKRKARVGRNPQTGEEIRVPSKWAPTFKASSALKKVTAER